MNTEIIIALIGGGVTLLSIIIPLLIKIKGLKTENEQAKAEINISRSASDFTNFIKKWGTVYNELIKLLEETNVDRFLILRAWNGKGDPKWTTAIFQLRQGKQEPISYVHFELDYDYVNRINEIVNENTAYYVVGDIPRKAEIRGVYDFEKVTASVWAFIGKKEYESNLHSVTYCSYSTHSDQLLTKAEVTRCKIISGMLKGMYSVFEASEEMKNE